MSCWAGVGGEGRETFYEAQRRHRRASWRFSVLSAVAVAMLGLPLSVLVAPVAAGTVILLNDVVNLVVPTPDIIAEIGDVGDRWSDAVEARNRGESASFPIAPAVVIALVLLLPGVVVMVTAWLLVRRIFMRSAVGAVVLAAGARPPNTSDVEERQLVNLVEEMALAAGVLPPRVMIVDGDILNAAVVGRSVEDVTFVVPRRLLEELGRDPTSAVIADLLATVVVGDLQAALVTASVFQTFDLVGVVIAAPFSRRSRRVLWRLVRMALRPRSRLGDGREAHFIAEELAGLAALGSLDDTGERSGCLTFPFLAASIAYTLTQGLVGLFFVTPVIAAMWRRRRLLADATAVELTRNPDALVQAFEHMYERAPHVPPGPWTHLYLIGPEVRQGLAKERYDRRLHELRADQRQPGESRLAAVRRKTLESIAAQRDYQHALDEGRDDSESLMRSGLDRFIPPLDQRLTRLEAMGGRLRTDPTASMTTQRPRPATPGGWVARSLLWIVGSVIGIVLLALMAVCGLMILVLLAALMYIALMFQMLVVLVPVVVIDQLLR